LPIEHEEERHHAPAARPEGRRRQPHLISRTETGRFRPVRPS
jgi:hypothetical protein